MDNYKEKVLLVEMEKACLALGPEAFMELVQETYGRALEEAQESFEEEKTENYRQHMAAVTCLIDCLEDPQQ